MCWPSLGCDGIVIGVGCSSAPFFPYALTVNVIGVLFLATVFRSASVFNGDLHQWDVAEVTTMFQSKSIRILENDLT
jgi:hypothetical protein